MTASMTSVLDRPSAGLREVLDDIEREDGNEPGGHAPWYSARICASAHVRLAATRIPSFRRAPRPVQEVCAPLLPRPLAATEEDLNRELDNPAEDWDQAVPRPVLPRAASPLPATSEVNCPHCNESNEAGSACKRCGN
ncbi:hypothetical protein ACWCV5_28295 [Streptomyces tubercidicus]